MRAIAEIKLSGDCEDVRELRPVVDQINALFEILAVDGIAAVESLTTVRGCGRATPEAAEAAKQQFEQRWQQRVRGRR
jgi:hypothetical protein